MKIIFAAILIAFILASCSSMTAGQKKMNAYQMHMNDHPDRNLVQMKRMRKR